jgi:GNAT superfamily N-acetyltransferase
MGAESVSVGEAGKVTLRAMTQADIERAVELSRDHGWPHREEDWSLLLDLGEGLVAELDGRVQGTIMAWRFGVDMATLGLVIVDKALQGRGMGRKMMEAMLNRLEGAPSSCRPPPRARRSMKSWALSTRARCPASGHALLRRWPAAQR